MCLIIFGWGSGSASVIAIIINFNITATKFTLPLPSFRSSIRPSVRSPTHSFRSGRRNSLSSPSICKDCVAGCHLSSSCVCPLSRIPVKLLTSPQHSQSVERRNMGLDLNIVPFWLCEWGHRDGRGLFCCGGVGKKNLSQQLFPRTVASSWLSFPPPRDHL